LLSDEQVGTLDDVLVGGLSVGIDEVGDVADVDGGRSTTARHEDVGLDTEVEFVAELGSVWDDLAAW
jgi:hypothetical protein